MDTHIVRELTDTQLLTQLKKRKVRLLMEMERVDMAIRAFERADENELNSLDILAYNPDIDIPTEDEVNTDLKTFKQYSPNMHNEQKVFWALEKMVEATAMEMADFLMHQDSTLKHRTLVVRGVTYTASRMFNLGKIKARKKGNINLYRLG